MIPYSFQTQTTNHIHIRNKHSTKKQSTIIKKLRQFYQDSDIFFKIVFFSFFFNNALIYIQIKSKKIKISHELAVNKQKQNKFLTNK